MQIGLVPHLDEDSPSGRPSRWAGVAPPSVT
jgi:hypothetical protein